MMNQPDILLKLDTGPAGFHNSCVEVDGTALPCQSILIEYPQKGLPVVALRIYAFRCRFELLEPSPPPEILHNCPHCGEKLVEEYVSE